MWFFDEQEFTEEDIGDYVGFVYLITNTTNDKKYIGRKYFWSVTTRPPLKGKKRKRKITKMSNWQDYYGSCEELLNDIEQIGKDKFRREILSLHLDKRDVNYCEVKEQFRYNVLESKLPSGEREYYNSNIMSKYFVRPEFISEETRRKLSDAHKGRIVSPETREKISKALKGKSKPPFAEEHRFNISQSLMGKEAWNRGRQGVDTHTPETRNKLSQIAKSLPPDHPSVKSRFKPGEGGSNGPLSVETRKKISEAMKEKSSFVTDNPNKKLVAHVLTEDGIVEIASPKSTLTGMGINYNALRIWSKKHLDDDKLHPKCKMKILKIVRP